MTLAPAARSAQGAAGTLGGDLVRQRSGHVLPPGGGWPERHSGRVADQVAAMTGLGQDKAGLASLDQEPVGEPGVVSAPVRRVGVNLRVKCLQLGRVLSGLAAVDQLERYLGCGHVTFSTLPGS